MANVVQGLAGAKRIGGRALAGVAAPTLRRLELSEAAVVVPAGGTSVEVDLGTEDRSESYFRARLGP